MVIITNKFNKQVINLINLLIGELRKCFCERLPKM